MLQYEAKTLTGLPMDAFKLLCAPFATCTHPDSPAHGSINGSIQTCNLVSNFGRMRPSACRTQLPRHVTPAAWLAAGLGLAM
jgi:hypothetical protein